MNRLSSRLEAYSVVAMALVFSVTLWLQAIASWDNVSLWPLNDNFVFNIHSFRWQQTGIWDWHQFEHWWELSLIAWQRHHEIALWDPFHCGGVPHWGQPQAQNFGPFYWVTGLVFGTAVGLKLFMIGHTFLGFVGMYVLARTREQLSLAGSLLAAGAWSGCGFFFEHGSMGHATFFTFYYFPWLLWFWYRAETDVRFVVPFVLVVGLLFGEGGTYSIPFAIVFLTLDSVLRTPSRILRRLELAYLALPLAVLVSAYRLLPTLITMQRNPRLYYDDDALRIREWIGTLTTSSHLDGVMPGHWWNWHEYAGYVGWATLFLATIGFFSAVRTGRAHLWLSAILFAMLCLGNRGPWWPTSILRHLPIFDSLRVPSRWQVVAIFYLALLAGLGLTEMKRWMILRAEWRAWIPAFNLMIALLVLADINRVANFHLDRWHEPPLHAGEPESEFFIANGPDYLNEQDTYPWRNIGTTYCSDPLQWPISQYLWTGQEPQVHVRDRSGNERWLSEQDTLRAFTRTVNTMHIEVDLAEPGRLIINQNWDYEWEANVRVVRDQQRLAVNLPAGRSVVDLRYRPKNLPLAVGLTLFGLVCCVGVLYWRQLRNWLHRVTTGV